MESPLRWTGAGRPTPIDAYEEPNIIRRWSQTGVCRGLTSNRVAAPICKKRKDAAPSRPSSRKLTARFSGKNLSMFQSRTQSRSNLSEVIRARKRHPLRPKRKSQTDVFITLTKITVPTRRRNSGGLEVLDIAHAGGEITSHDMQDASAVAWSLVQRSVLAWSALADIAQNLISSIPSRYISPRQFLLLPDVPSLTTTSVLRLMRESVPKCRF